MVLMLTFQSMSLTTIDLAPTGLSAFSGHSTYFFGAIASFSISILIVSLWRNRTHAKASDQDTSDPIIQPQSMPQSIRQWLSPDRLVPASRSIEEVSSALKHCSPWQDHVLPEEPQAILSNWKALITEFVGSIHLVVKYVRKYWAPYWVTGVVSALCLMSMQAYQLLAAQKLGMSIDQGATVLIQSAIQLAVLLPIAYGLFLWGSRVSVRLASRLSNEIRYDLFKELQLLSQDFHKNARLGDILTHFSIDIQKIEPVLGQELVSGICEAVMTLVSIAMLARISWSLSILSALPLLVLLPITFSLTVNMTKRLLKAVNQTALMIDAVQEGMRSQPMISGNGLQRLFAKYFADELTRLEDKKTEGAFSYVLFLKTVDFSANFLRVWVMGVGGSYVLADQITLGEWVAFFTISQTTYEGLAQLLNKRFGRWIESGIGMRRLDSVLEHPTKVIDRPDSYPLSSFQQEIRFEKLSFSYDNQNFQLKDLDLSINAREFVAFVGSSGAGKSTVFNLLMRFYDITHGQITIDGHDIQKLTRKSLQSQVGMVLQDTFLFNTTILNNIRIARPEATDDEVFAAAQAAEVHDFITSLPDGYQTLVGEGGGRLSGGQRQRIAIAQALLRSPPILLLDEPTSSLSAEMADAINQTIASLAGKHTVIMITHQLKAATKADRILVLDQGRLVEQGTHQELLAQNGHYHYLWDIQQKTNFPETKSIIY
jgi:ATP-binding cassette subfamily B protein